MATILDKLMLVGLAYLLGSVPMGVLIAAFRNIDITKVGSKNIGATNVARAMGFRMALATGILDLLKGWVPVIVAHQVMDSPWGVSLVAAAAVTGHCASIFLDFKGGKGVATSAGVFLALVPIPTLATAGVWVGVMAWSRVSSLSALVALPVLLLGLFVSGSTGTQWVPLALFIMGLVLWRHRDNIKNLRTGSERKFLGTDPPAKP